ncbi:MAG: YihY/virulence factor BrkB family protein [Alphaproteobacteria bacterium]
MFKALQNSTRHLIETDVSDKPYWKAVLIRIAQVTYASFRDLADGQLSLQAMSLVYTTLITLVPLLAISFSVLKGFGVHNEIEPFLSGMLAGLGPEKSEEVTQKVIEFVDNVKVGVLGFLGLALLLYAVIALMQKIEAAFNYIWRVGEDRTFAQRFSDYLSVLLMGPLLIFISAGITTAVRNSTALSTLGNYTSVALLFDVGSFLLPWLVMAAGFTFFYVYMPNTKVKISAAFAGGLIAALLWKTMGYIFSSFIAGSANYVAIYAAFATMIILMIWIYASWLVILIGSNISFYAQYPRYLYVSRSPLVLSPYMRMMLGLSIMSLIANSHYKKEEPWTLERLSKKLNVPILAVQKLADILESGGVLACCKGDPCSYFPAVPLDKTPLQFLIDALEKQGKQGWMHNESVYFTKEAKAIADQLDQIRQDKLTCKSLRDVLVHD